MLETMQIFKCLPAAKKMEHANCKECGYPNCMAFSLKLSKGQATIDKCPYAPNDLIEKVQSAQKIQQKTVVVGGITLGGETVMYRHEKTFINKTAFIIRLNPHDKDKLQRILDFEIESVGVKFKIDGVFLDFEDENVAQALKNAGITPLCAQDLENLQEIGEHDFAQACKMLDFIRHKAIVERDEAYSMPVFAHIKSQNPYEVAIYASSYISKCINAIVFDYFDEAILTTLITYRQNIFTDPEKPLQVESKVYKINNPDENAHVLLTTNFALTYFAVANELSSIKRGSYLVITPSDGMSVLTAWSAEKITSQIAAEIVCASDILSKVKDKTLVIPGLLADLKEELEESLKEWKIVIGPIEAYKLPEFLRNLG